jgi:hypothetical protein
MTSSELPLTRTDAGTFPGSTGPAGVFSTTHGKGDGGLAAARAVLAKVSDCDDLQIARACWVVLASDRSEPQENRDARDILDRLEPDMLAHSVNWKGGHGAQA